MNRNSGKALEVARRDRPVAGEPVGVERPESVQREFPEQVLAA
ncbi:hypothetical protein [Streptomyces resistomycificus]|nr:hypothetical protein [Streptomyces resistomycificus]